MASETKPASVADELVADGAVGLKESVRFSGLPRSTLYELMLRGELPFTKVGRRRLIPRQSLVKLLAKGLVSSGGCPVM